MTFALGIVPLALATSATAVAQQRFTVIGHAVHERSATGAEGGNVVADFEKATNSKVEWLTFGVTPIHERLFREASLSEGAVDAAFLLNRFTNENVKNLFEPLDDYQAKDPIADFDGISRGMRDAMTFDGKLYGIPYRHATHGLLYNEELLKERGLSGPPKTFEEVIEYADKLTYTRADGTQVSGIVFGGQGPANIIDVIRAFGGDFLTTDFELKADQAGMIRGVELLTDWYKRGVLPKASVGFTTEDVITFMQQGRAAMTINPFGRFRQFNDPEKSKFPGAFKAVAVPTSASLSGGTGKAAVKTEIWALVIPKNAPDKERSWKFIKQLSSLDAAVAGAINGNGPVRAAAYQDPGVQSKVPYWDAEAAAVEVAQVPLPGFANSAKVDDMVKEEIQAAMLGSKSPEQAMKDLARRVRPLLPN
jgi:multiple sugar transport system substrate-binding protein